MEIANDCFFCIVPMEGKDVFTLYNLNKEEALALCMKYVARSSHELGVPNSVLFRQMKILREVLLLYDLDVERQICMQEGRK